MQATRRASWRTITGSAALLALALPVLAGDALVTSWNTNSILRYDETTGALIGTFVASGAGGLQTPHSARYGPDGNLYVSSFGASAVLRYDGQTGAFIDAFVPSGSGGLSGATDALFGPDGNLYVPSFSTPGVKRYNGQTGAFIDNFITPGNGLVAAESGCFGPDGDFYLANSSGNNILRYDGQTGAFVSVFASSSLNDTHALTFGPNGNLYASAFGNQRVHEFDGQTGAFVRVFVGLGNNLVSAHSMAFHEGSFFVTSFGRDRVNEHDAVTGAFLRTYVLPGAGGLDGPISITFMPDPPSLTPYGCGSNPAGSLPVLAGTPAIGTSFTLGVDNPAGTQSAGSIPFLYLALDADPLFPCGTLLPRFGQGGPGTSGELLLDLRSVFLRQVGGPWSGAGNPVPFSLAIPPELGLVGTEFRAQGLLIDMSAALGLRFGLTEALSGVIGF